MGGVTTAVFDDTCGNLIQIARQSSTSGPQHKLRSYDHASISAGTLDSPPSLTIYWRRPPSGWPERPRRRVTYGFFGPGWLQPPLPRPAREWEARG
jgi:hypothetical protein